MSQIEYKDIVEINHPEVTGTGIVTRFYQDKFNGVEVEIAEVSFISL